MFLLLLDLDNDDDKDEAREPVNRCASEMATVLGTVLGASVKNGNLAMLAAMFGAIGNGTMLGAMLDENMKNGNLAMLAAIIAPQNNLLLCWKATANDFSSVSICRCNWRQS